ncbi:MAG: hypothetical protein IH597_13245 [Bacteroidales bacterium]|nr:hypothetical protein [Bacteroidales bacterium]
MKTIDEVLLKMDEIVEDCKKRSSRLGYFAVLYRMVTRRIKKGIDRKEFEDNARMELLDILFAKRFLDAYDLYNNKQIPTQCWHVAFKAAEESRLLVMHHLLLGINAHINLDLGIAAVETMQGKPLAGIENDFNKINAILAEMVEGVKTNISGISLIFGLALLLANKKDEILVSFSINIARQGAWDFASRYAIDTDRESALKQRDVAIAKIAQRLGYPGWRMRRIIDIVRLGEFQSVAEVIELLDVLTAKTSKLQQKG